MTVMEKILKRIDGYRDEIIEIQSGLTSRVALGPENGGTGEHEKSEYIMEILSSLEPAILDEIKAPDDRAKDGYRPNIIATWGDDVSKPSIWILSHSDVVPPGDLSLWESDPYKIKVVGDRIIGRGVEDNQHGFVSSFLAIKAIRDSGASPAMPVGLAVVADEETGSSRGLDYILKTRGELFTKDDMVIVPDSGNEDGTMIEVAEKSMLWIKFTVTGVQCHASTPDKGRNSLYGAARLIVALEEIKKKFDLKNNLFKPPVSTFESTKMESNVPNINTIPGRDVFYMDCRILPEYEVDEILARSLEIVSEIEGELGLKIQLEEAHRQDSTEPTSPDAPVVKALSAAIRKVTGREAKPMGIGGGTVAAFFRREGIPAAVWCTMPDTAHQPNEYCLISNIITDAKIFACLYMGASV
ncbi:M20 family metallo-hydrolase [Thermodesulfobacteriota bacterium]